MDPLGPNPTDRIPVLREHLQEIFSAVDWARTHAYALDLADSAKKGISDNQQSRLTANLSRAHQHLAGYLNPTIEEL